MSRVVQRPGSITRLRVLEAGSGLPTAIVARLLHDSGATVLRAARTGPDPFGERYPALRSWSRDWTEVDAGNGMDDALASVDVLLVGAEDHPDAGPPARLELAELACRHPRLVVLEIGGYVRGTNDPTPAVDLLVQARTGFVFEQFSDRPTQLAFAPSLYGAALLGTIGVWAALHARRRTGRGGRVRVSMQQGLALFWPHLWLSAEHPDQAFDTVPPRDVKHLVLRCADGGYLQIVLGVPGAVARVHRVLGIPGPVDPADRGVPSLARGAENYFADRDLFSRYAARFPRDELVEAFAVAGVPVEPVLAPGEFFDDPQVLAAGLVATAPDGREYPAGPVDLSVAGDPPAAQPAPRRVRCGESAPLAGLRIIDLGNWVAGPFASKLLADLGADVIKVEPPTGLSNLTGIRNTLTSNRGKRSIVVDMKTPEGHEIVRRLAATADAVHHNFRPGVAERLGVDAASLRECRPGLVYLHTTAYGRTGPRALRGGFDMVMQALCGHEVRAGGKGNEPLWYRAPFVDYCAGALGAIALLSALYERDATGAPVDAHTSLLGAAMFLRGELVREPDGSIAGAAVLSADRTGFHPTEALYRAADGWLAVAAYGESMAAALSDALELTGLGPPSKWNEEAAHAIGTAIGRLTCDDALSLLGAAGVWATRCTGDAFAAMLADDAAHRSGLVISAPDPRYGRVTGCFGPLIGFSGWTPDPDGFRSAPLSGEHTAALLAEAGYSADERARLERDGIVRAAPGGRMLTDQIPTT
ncbi:CoA transferase [Streptosporangium sp. NPDC006013]|uniref:CoA transferase n=1 Tax=Streptosporangium sp. NPDC006013 TaxID=3155596 RepID=UPI0033B62C60